MFSTSLPVKGFRRQFRRHFSWYSTAARTTKGSRTRKVCLGDDGSKYIGSLPAALEKKQQFPCGAENKSGVARVILEPHILKFGCGPGSTLASKSARLDYRLHRPLGESINRNYELSLVGSNFRLETPLSMSRHFALQTTVGSCLDGKGRKALFGTIAWTQTLFPLFFDFGTDDPFVSSTRIVSSTYVLCVVCIVGCCCLVQLLRLYAKHNTEITGRNRGRFHAEDLPAPAACRELPRYVRHSERSASTSTTAAAWKVSPHAHGMQVPMPHNQNST